MSVTKYCGKTSHSIRLIFTPRNSYSNRKAFLSNANRPLSNNLYFIMNKFECVAGGAVEWGPSLTSLNMSGGELYTEVQIEQFWICMGQGQGQGPSQGTPPVNRQTDKIDWKHHLPATSLVGGNNNFLHPTELPFHINPLWRAVVRR